MKQRKGFVTNSSSSSFIIAFKDVDEFDQETLNKYPFLKYYKNLVSKILCTTGYETDEGTIYNTKGEFDNYILECYGWGKDTIEDIPRIVKEEDIEKFYNETIDYINKGYKIINKYIDYCEDGLINIIRNLAESENVHIINEYK